MAIENTSGNLEPDIVCTAGGKTLTVLLWLATVAGLVLSLLSAFKICTAACSAAGKYTIFGMDFGWFGCAFFLLLMLLLALRRSFPKVGIPLLFATFAALGAEVWLIWLQKYVIGAWCPVCLAIAVIIATAALVLVCERSVESPSSGGTMKSRFSSFAILTVALIAGFASAMAGVGKEAEAAGPDIYLGKRQSNTTVYIISDWFCPSCRKLEPEMEKIYQEIAPKARIAFIDMPVHAETSNYTPYNIQLMIHEKEKYLRLRHAMDGLSRTNKNPAQEQFQAALTPLGVTLKPHNFMEIANGIKLFESIFIGFGIKSTPTVVVDNPKTAKRKLLVGTGEITRNAIKEAVREVEK